MLKFCSPEKYKPVSVTFSSTAVRFFCIYIIMWICLIQFYAVKLNGCTLLRKWKTRRTLTEPLSRPYLFLLSVDDPSDLPKQPETSVSCRLRWSHIVHHWTTWPRCGAFSHFFNCFRKWGRVTKFRKLRVAINITEQRAKAAENQRRLSWSRDEVTLIFVMLLGGWSAPTWKNPSQVVNQVNMTYFHCLF